MYTYDNIHTNTHSAIAIRANSQRYTKLISMNLKYSYKVPVGHGIPDSWKNVSNCLCNCNYSVILFTLFLFYIAVTTHEVGPEWDCKSKGYRTPNLICHSSQFQEACAQGK